MTLTWTSKQFTSLTIPELYDLLQLRSAVFVVEQACAFQDIDGQDAAAYHLLGYAPGGKLGAYARLFDAGVVYAEVSIGRVVVAQDFRRYGLGKELMRRACPLESSLQPQLELFVCHSRCPCRRGAQGLLRPLNE